MLASVIANVSGKSLKNAVKESVFMPDFLGKRKSNKANPSLEQQEADMKAFADKLKSMTGKK